MVLKIVRMLFEPLNRIEPVERDTRLKYIDQRIAFMLYGLFQYIHGLIYVTGEGPCDKARVQSGEDRKQVLRESIAQAPSNKTTVDLGLAIYGNHKMK